MALLEKIKNVLKTGNVNPPQPEQATKDPDPATSETKTHMHKIAGVTQYEKNILKLAIENPEYRLNKKEIISRGLCETSIYQYKFSPEHTELIPEPTNQYDPNAIMVVIDGEHVGYIKAGSCSRILKLIKENRIEKVESKITGGAYKTVNRWGDGKNDFEMEKERTNYGIKIYITEK